MGRSLRATREGKYPDLVMAPYGERISRCTGVRPSGRYLLALVEVRHDLDAWGTVRFTRYRLGICFETTWRPPDIHEQRITVLNRPLH